MKKILMCLLTLSLVQNFAACASKSAKPDELEQKISKESPAQTPDEIAQRGAAAFISAPGLTQDQRQKLMEVYTRTYLGAEEIRAQIGQSKSLLFKMIAKNSYKSKEMAELKTKVVALDQKRLDLMFQALADVQAIVGYGGDQDEIYKHFEMYEIPSVHVRQ